MAAIMMMPGTGPTTNVTGSRSAIAAGGPNPGRIPTTIPRMQPSAANIRFVGVRTAWKPASRLESVSTITPYFLKESRQEGTKNPGRKLDAQRGRHEQEAHDREQEPRQDGGPPPPPGQDGADPHDERRGDRVRSEEHTSE